MIYIGNVYFEKAWVTSYDYCENNTKYYTAI